MPDDRPIDGISTREPDPEYVAARRVLLDALQALAPHRSAVIVAGAQAVYLRTGDSDIGIAPYTTDGDLALDPTLLSDDPELEEIMHDAGFRLLEPDPRSSHAEPGIWTAVVTVAGSDRVVPIDLIVPEAVAGKRGRRGARLGSHGNRAARQARGLEAALVDHTTMTITALEASDTRAFSVEVAGAAALLVAKAHKIHDRLASQQADRLVDKDAADVYRLMQTTSPLEIGQRLHQLRLDDRAREVTAEAASYLTDLFGRRNGEGIRMATRALRLAVPEQQIVTLATRYVERMLSVSQ